MRRFAAGLLALALGAPLAATSGTEPVQVYVFTRSAYSMGGESEIVSPKVFVPQGAGLVLVNLHVWGHSIVSDGYAYGSERLFMSEVIPFRRSAVVRGVEALAPGDYAFHCMNHRGMKGSLVIMDREEP